MDFLLLLGGAWSLSEMFDLCFSTPKALQELRNQRDKETEYMKRANELDRQMREDYARCKNILSPNLEPQSPNPIKDEAKTNG